MKKTKQHNPPAFQLYTKDILASESVSLMTCEQVGWYLFLLCHAWNSDPIGTLPNDKDKLRMLARATQSAWDSFNHSVLCNFEEDGDRLVNRRLVEQFKQMEANRKARSENGKKGGRPAFRQLSSSSTPAKAEKSPSSSSSASTSSSLRDVDVDLTNGTQVKSQSKTAAFEVRS